MGPVSPQWGPLGSYGAHGGAHMLDPYVRSIRAIHARSGGRDILAYVAQCGGRNPPPPLVYSIMGSVIAHYAVCKCVRRFNPSTIYIKRVGFAEVLGVFCRFVIRGGKLISPKLIGFYVERRR